MNHLAHTYLSSANAQEQAGNFVADWIKGSDLRKYPLDIRRGIILHRFIDSYTDKHPSVRDSKSRLKPKYGKYAGVAVDVIYDHFLAANWAGYSKESLPAYICRLNQNLQDNLHLFPEGAQKYFVRFMKLRWLESYTTLEGVERVLFGMGKFRSLPEQSRAAIDIVRNNYGLYAKEFEVFFAALKAAIQVNNAALTEKCGSGHTETLPRLARCHCGEQS